MILMYHHVTPVSDVPLHPDPNEGWNYCISPKGFERQLVALMQRGYRFISLAELVDDIRNHGAEDPKSLTLTFDDGWSDNFGFALPILTELSIPATFFVTTAHIRNDEDDSRKISVAQLKELMHAGMTIGGHTRSHPDLTALQPGLACEEIVGCKDDLEGVLGTQIEFFAYPGGTFNRTVARLAQEAGYTAACSILGPALNDASSLFWLYRDTLTESMSTWGDRYRLCPMARRLLAFRVKRRLKARLAEPAWPATI